MEMEKTELHNMQYCSVRNEKFWPICLFHCMLCCFDSEWSHVSSWI